MTPQLIEQTLLQLADIAAAETMPRFRVALNVTNKLDEGFDPVTQADKQAESAIRDYIAKHFPDHGVLGEEQEATNIGAEYCWVIDPVDGTRAFISGLPGWGTLIGLSKNNEPIAGIMCQPFTGERFIATSANNIAYLLHKGVKTNLKTSNVTALSDATVMTTDPDLFKPNELEIFNKIKSTAKLTRYGYDCYAYAMLAAGHIDLVIESGLNAYDISALIPIVKQSGGIVVNWQGKSAANGGQILAAANEKLLNETISFMNSAI